MARQIRRGDPRRQNYWEEVVRRWKEGGRSVREFCHAEGMRESAFYFWRRKLKSGSRPSATVGQSSRPASRRLPEPRRGTPSFLPVRVTGPVNDCPDLVEKACGVEIVLRQGRLVRVRAGFDRQTLTDVLDVLEVRSC